MEDQASLLLFIYLSFPKSNDVKNSRISEEQKKLLELVFRRFYKAHGPQLYVSSLITMVIERPEMYMTHAEKETFGNLSHGQIYNYLRRKTIDEFGTAKDHHIKKVLMINDTPGIHKTVAKYAPEMHDAVVERKISDETVLPMRNEYDEEIVTIDDLDNISDKNVFYIKGSNVEIHLGSKKILLNGEIIIEHWTPTTNFWRIEVGFEKSIIILCPNGANLYKPVGLVYTPVDI